MNIVAHNMMAMNAQRQFGINNSSKAKTIEKLSSGFRINRAADDAAGLAISEKMRRQIRGLTQGVSNTQDGVSLCQVADGALDEVSEMLNRIEELSVKAANETNTAEERHYIQQEINELVVEIDRISDTTTFNEVPLFKGRDVAISNADGTPLIEGNIPFSDFQMADLALGQSPFSSSSTANTLGLQAVVKNHDSAAYGKEYNLIYGSGGTSSPSIRVKYTDGSGIEQTATATLNTLPVSNFTSGTTGGGKPYWSREISYQNADGVDITITQKITAQDDSASDKNYLIEYQIDNNQASGSVEVDFMFHADTAYNNNDQCEGYYIDGNRVDKSCIYSTAGSKFTDGSANANVHTGIPGSFSIVDVDSALAFSEKIQFSAGSMPDSFCVGNYSQIHQWSYYDNLDSNLGANAIRDDLGFTAMWNYDLAGGAHQNFGFTYGIAATENDNNLRDITVNKSTNSTVEHYATNPIWIQSGSENFVGMELVIGEMNSEVLHLKGIDVTTVSGANDAMERTKTAQKNLMENRSNIGAQQNRLEHTINNENNIVENTTASESAIRDADMSKEMVQLSIKNILEQAGTSMMAQANQSNQGVLSLLS